jgi:D-amino peptidase
MRAIAVALTLITSATIPVHAQQRLKVYISVDMEGVTGVVTDQQLGPAGFEYQRFREFMTAEALAAIQGAREAGATEIVVSDAHGNGQNLLIERFPADVTIVRSWPRPLMMMEGIDSTFHAAIFIGYHSGTHNREGVRAHTISSANLTDVQLNGQQMSESTINATIAAHFGVPVVMISGDDAAVNEARAAFGAEGAVVKRAISFHAAATMTPEAGQALIKERVRTALARRASFKPYTALRAPYRLDVSFKNYRPVEILAYLPIVERIASHTIRYNARNIIEVSKFIEFITSYAVDITP